jgi:signal transduction histidine kinase
MVILSRRRYQRVAAYFLVGIYFLLAVYCMFQWGISFPLALFLYVICISLTGILISSRASLVLTFIIALVISLRVHLQRNGIAQPDLSWMDLQSNAIDVIGQVLSLSIIAIASWLSTREIERSLARARRSEAELKEERDQLETRVEERTQELQQAQLERVSQLYRFAEFGRITSGILHDLVNPLNAISLNLSQLEGNSEQSKTLKRAIQGAKRIEQFVNGARQQINNQRELSVFSLRQNTQEALGTLTEKAKKAKAHLHSNVPASLELYGGPLRFQQLISNLVSNALDSYEEVIDNRTREITVTAEATESEVVMTVEDNGSGISPENQKFVFDSLFSTKPGTQNSGLGLSIVKEIVEKEFNGSIELTSKPGKGTTFTMKLPIHVPGASS